MSLRLIRQAVGLLTLTNVDGDLDRKCEPIRESGCAHLIRYQASAGPILASASPLGVMGRERCGKCCDPAEQSDDCHQK